MRRLLYIPGRSVILGFLATIGGCSPSARTAVLEPRVIPSVAPDACCFREGLAVARAHRVPLIDERRFTPNEYWGAMQGALDRSPRVRREEIGRSVQGRPLVALHMGEGPVKVLAWSQMHGDESTASMALLDLVHWVVSDEPDAVRDRLLASISLTLVPMLNPDGAERFQRRNAQGVDINRDARRLVTPEARILKQLRDEIQPVVGFNLHNQNWRTRAGDQPASISLLAVAFDEARTVDAGRLLTMRLGTTIRDALQPLAEGRIGRYDDSFEPRAFGDNITLWGTPVLLIETGPWPEVNPDPALVRLNFVALVAALDSLAAGRVHTANPRRYEALPMNDSGLFYRAIRGGDVLRGDGQPPFRADVGIAARRGVRVKDGVRELWESESIEDIGDLSTSPALFDIDATGLIVAPFVNGATVGNDLSLPDWTASSPSQPLVQQGSPASLMLLRPLDGGRYRVERVIAPQRRVACNGQGC